MAESRQLAPMTKLTSAWGEMIHGDGGGGGMVTCGGAGDMGHANKTC